MQCRHFGFAPSGWPVRSPRLRTRRPRTGLRPSLTTYLTRSTAAWTMLGHRGHGRAHGFGCGADSGGTTGRGHHGRRRVRRLHHVRAEDPPACLHRLRGRARRGRGVAGELHRSGALVAPRRSAHRSNHVGPVGLSGCPLLGSCRHPSPALRAPQHLGMTYATRARPPRCRPTPAGSFDPAAGASAWRVPASTNNICTTSPAPAGAVNRPPTQRHLTYRGNVTAAASRQWGRPLRHLVEGLRRFRSIALRRYAPEWITRKVVSRGCVLARATYSLPPEPTPLWVPRPCAGRDRNRAVATRGFSSAGRAPGPGTRGPIPPGPLVPMHHRVGRLVRHAAGGIVFTSTPPFTYLYRSSSIRLQVV